MAKKPKTSKPETALPSVDQKSIPVESELTTAESESIPVESKPVEIPVAKVRHGYEARRCDVQRMTGKQKENLRRITNGLIAKDAKLENGRIVSNNQDSIKWLLEQV